MAATFGDGVLVCSRNGGFELIVGLQREDCKSLLKMMRSLGECATADVMKAIGSDGERSSYDGSARKCSG